MSMELSASTQAGDSSDLPESAAGVVSEDDTGSRIEGWSRGGSFTISMAES